MLTRFRTDAGPPRRSPSVLGRLGRIALAGLALVVAGQGFGCSNYRSFRDPVALNPCNPCDPVAVAPPPQDNIFRRIGRRIFGPRDPVPMVAAAPLATGCAPETIMAAPVVAAPTVIGAPAVAVPTMGAPIAVPAGPPGAVAIPQGARPAGPPPDEDNSGLQEAPGSGLSPRSGSSPAPAGGGNSKTNYQSMKPPSRSSAEGLARANPNEPARGPARTPSTANSGDGSGAVGRMLDQLPVPSLGQGEGERTTAQRADNPPQPLDSELRDRLNQTRPAAAAEPEPISAAAEPPPRSAEAPSTVAVGISPFRILDSGIAGGGMPSVDGFAWLHEKGYRTFVDLRDPADVPAGEVAELNRLGMKHVRIPINPKAIDAEALAKFEEVLADKAARPVYFCDANGNRAGLAWYLHRVVVDRMAADLASREAEQLGLGDPKILMNAADYLRRKNVASPADERPDVPPPPPLGPTDLDPSALAPAFPEPSLSLDEPTAARSGSQWEAFAMPMAALLCAPLAYWGRTTIASTVRIIARASLPAPSRSTRSLPRA